ncbi:MAG TPA: hypothetical protein VEK57_14000 [Thermoanaerobaculia bacterium]|nr:hypothetical protein [Thermoanaerobaculia bacterium]
MPAAVKRRLLADLVAEICKERSIAVTEFSDDWLLRLQLGDRVSHIFGYDFGVNNATAQMIAKDKSATSDMLQHAGIPHVHHTLVNTPETPQFVPDSGNWAFLTNYLAQHGSEIVCKPNDGTGGHDVHRVTTIHELEAAVQRLFGRRRAFCVSPFLRIAVEYRLVVVQGTVRLIYAKQRPRLTGDGTTTVGELLIDRIRGDEAASNFLPAACDSKLDMTNVLPAGEVLELDWRHNLGRGAEPVIVERESGQASRLIPLALSAAAAIGIDSSSVDIVEVDGSLMVLEINAGIMMEAFGRRSPADRDIARSIYDALVCAVMDIPA